MVSKRIYWSSTHRYRIQRYTVTLQPARLRPKLSKREKSPKRPPKGSPPLLILGFWTDCCLAPKTLPASEQSSGWILLSYTKGIEEEQRSREGQQSSAESLSVTAVNCFLLIIFSVWGSERRAVSFPSTNNNNKKRIIRCFRQSRQKWSHLRSVSVGWLPWQQCALMPKSCVFTEYLHGLECFRHPANNHAFSGSRLRWRRCWGRG